MAEYEAAVSMILARSSTKLNQPAYWPQNILPCTVHNT